MLFRTLKAKFIYTVSFFILIFMLTGISAIYIINRYDSEIEALVTLNNSFLSLTRELDQYKTFLSRSGNLKEINLDNISRHISNLQIQNKVFVLGILKQVRENLLNIDIFITKLKIKDVAIQEMRKSIYQFQHIILIDLELKDKQFNNILMKKVRKNNISLNTREVDIHMRQLDEHLLSLNNAISYSIQTRSDQFKYYLLVLFGINIFILAIAIALLVTKVFKRLKVIHIITVSLKNLSKMPSTKASEDELGVIISSLRELYNQLEESKRKVKQKENQLSESNDRLKQLNHSLVDTIENERLDISQYIHNNLGQNLTGIQLQLEFLKRKYMNKVDIVNSMEESKELILNSLNDIRNVSQSVHPPLINEHGLKRSIKYLFKSFEKYPFHIKENLELEHKTLSISQEISMYRIIQEAIINIARHANASQVYVESYKEEGKLILKVEDNGVGIKKDIKFSMGLKGIESRVNYLMGSFDFKNRKSGGTLLYVKIPLGSKL